MYTKLFPIHTIPLRNHGKKINPLAELLVMTTAKNTNTSTSSGEPGLRAIIARLSLAHHRLCAWNRARKRKRKRTGGSWYTQVAVPQNSPLYPIAPSSRKEWLANKNARTALARGGTSQELRGRRLGRRRPLQVSIRSIASVAEV